METSFWSDSKTWVAISFFVFFIVFGKKLWKPLAALLDSRADLVRAELEEAARLRREAENMLRDAQLQRDRAVEDAQRLVAGAQAEAERLAVAAARALVDVGDAERAAGAGMDGIIVSNHGGRQVDGAIAALDALPAIAAAVGSRITVLFDSGIRGGPDMLKALALGARAVLIGRPYAFGLGMGGEDGVRHVLRALRNDFELTMRLSGYARLDELCPQSLVRTGPSS